MTHPSGTLIILIPLSFFLKNTSLVILNNVISRFDPKIAMVKHTICCGSIIANAAVFPLPAVDVEFHVWPFIFRRSCIQSLPTNFWHIRRRHCLSLDLIDLVFVSRCHPLGQPASSQCRPLVLKLSTHRKLYFKTCFERLLRIVNFPMCTVYFLKFFGFKNKFHEIEMILFWQTSFLRNSDVIGRSRFVCKRQAVDRRINK